MSLKAGRVGVRPDQVNLDGSITQSASGAYTKSESDNKFLSKTDAASTYETKSAAADLQPKTLSLPISTLDGSKTTVENALTGLAFTESAASNLLENIEVVTTDGMGNHLRKVGNLVEFMLEAQAVTCTAWTSTLCTIPEGYRPITDVFVGNIGNGADNAFLFKVLKNGGVLPGKSLTNGYIRVVGHWFTGSTT